MFGRKVLSLGVVAFFSVAAPLISGDLSVGEEAPDFSLVDQEGFLHSLKHHLGQYVLLFFYPRDFLVYSVYEVKAFEQAYQALKGKNIVIYGISNDFQASHFAFHKKFNLTYDLLSDPNEEVIKLYNAKSFWGKKFVSYLIDPDGRIFRKYMDVSPEKHPMLILNDMQN